MALHELKKFAFFAHQKLSIYRKLTNRPQKPLVFATKTSLVRTTFYCPQKPPSYLQKPIFCTSLSLQVSKTAHFHKPKAFLLHKSFLNCYPKQSFFALRFPFQRPLPYCLQRMRLFFLMFALILCCKAGMPHRFKSLPAIPGKVVISGIAGYLMNAGHFSKNLVSTGDLNRGSQGFAPCAFWLLFAQRKK